MKKLFLLGALVCVGQLYGMELQPSYETLLPELKQEIISAALATSKDLDEAVTMIEKLSALHGVRYDNLKNFTKLVHMIADKFDWADAYYFARNTILFNAPAAKEYTELAQELNHGLIIGQLSVEDVRKLISKGVDINNSRDTISTYLWSRAPLKAEMIKLLLDNGAYPNNEATNYGETKAGIWTPLQYLNKFRQNAPEYEQIKQLLEEAIEKQQ